MPEIPILHDIVIIFGFALVVISLSSRLKIPPVVGFLLTGMAIGPHGLGLIHDTETVKVFAELGVVFLLFIVGLELSPARLKRLGRIILVGGTLQTVGTILAVVLLCYALNYSLRISIYFSFLVTLSSTAIVLKLYSERRELETTQGETVMGILLFQDFLIVPLLLVVPVLAGSGAASLATFALRFGGGLLIVAAVFVVGRYLLPRLLHLLIHTRVRELTVIAALFACIGAAVLTETLGFSLALGAFIAGLMIAESDYRYQVLAETVSFRDVFNSMFFISVGMLLQLNFAAQNAGFILAVGLMVVLLKAVVLLFAIGLLAFPWRIRLIGALGLAQFSEFSFVLIQMGDIHGLLDPWHYQMAVATAVFTMIITPLLVIAGPWLTNRLFGQNGPLSGGIDQSEESIEAQVVLFGYGHNGQHLARAMKDTQVSYSIVELNGRTVRQAKAKGEPIIFGDSTRLEIQEKCGIEHAQIAVFVISDRMALRDSIRLARHVNPEIFIIARSRQLSEVEELKQCGADAVVVVELEASVKLLAITLTHLHLPNKTVRQEVVRARQDVYGILRDLPSALSDKVIRALETETTGTFLLRHSAAKTQQTLSELDLRHQTGVTVIAVYRGEQAFTNPAPDMPLEGGDALVLVGTHDQIDKARHHLDLATAD
jgi:CPA2 family monovalent cation:H+ antiporter-2